MAAAGEDSLKVRRVQESDFEDIMELMRLEGWFVLNEARLRFVYLEKLADLYVLVKSNDDSTILGIATICKGRDGEAVLGNVIIRKTCRSRGLGTYFIRQVLSRHDDVIVTWVSTADPFYEKLGFQNCEQTAAFGEVALQKAAIEEYLADHPVDGGVRTTNFTEDRTEDLMRYDAEARGYENGGFVSFMTKASDHVTMAVSGPEQRIVGYVAICAHGHTNLFVNGLYADNNRITALLARSILENFPKAEKVCFYTLASRQFLLQLGQTLTSKPLARFSSGRSPARIPEDKLCCFSYVDLAC